MHRRSRLGRLAALALVALTTCSDPVDVTDPIVVEFDLTLDQLSAWAIGSSDYLASQEAAVEFQAEKRALPDNLGGGPAFYHAGTNISDDLWMYFARQVQAFQPGATYRLGFQVHFATNQHSGCTVGTGPSVWIKAGASTEQPARLLSGDGSWRMNVDKGEQSQVGSAAVLLGDIRNGLPGCPSPPQYQANVAGDPTETIAVTADDSGAIWLFFGTESGFESRHEIYFTRFTVQATLQD